MSKKVLIVEPSLAVRNIAESLLRQNGYEVLSADGVDAARAILQESRIDLILTASDVAAGDGRPFYEVLGSDSSTATLPLLILHDQAAGELPYPPEAIVNKPFTPREFLDAVAAFTGGQVQPAAVQETPFSGSDVEDDLIDQALGLDKLEVDQTDVIGNDTGVFRVLNKKVTKESMLGYEYKAPADDTITEKSKKIDQINVPTDKQQQGPPVTQPPQEGQKAVQETEFLGHDSQKHRERPADQMSASSKIEIVTDQYGIASPPDPGGHANEGDAGGNHDYDWFVKEMQKEAASGESAPADSGSLAISPTSEGREPVSPPPESDIPLHPALSKPDRQDEIRTHGQAVDKFISEFKKEMDKITEDASPDFPDIPITNVAAEGAMEPKAKSQLDWEEAVENISSSDIRRISKDLVDAVAARVTEQILARIDREMVYRVIRDCFSETLEKTLRNKSSNS